MLGFRLLHHLTSKAHVLELREPAQFLPAPTPASPTETGAWLQQEKAAGEAAARARTGVYTQISARRRLGSPQHPTSTPTASKREQGLGWDPGRRQRLVLIALRHPNCVRDRKPQHCTCKLKRGRLYGLWLHTG